MVSFQTQKNTNNKKNNNNKRTHRMLIVDLSTILSVYTKCQVKIGWGKLSVINNRAHLNILSVCQIDILSKPGASNHPRLAEQ